MLNQRYLVLRMEPLVGDDVPTERTSGGPGIQPSSAGPSMQAPRQFEGQEVTLGQLEGMGRLEWQDEGVALLHTANESYRVELQPVELHPETDEAATRRRT